MLDKDINFYYDDFIKRREFMLSLLNDSVYERKVAEFNDWRNRQKDMPKEPLKYQEIIYSDDVTRDNIYPNKYGYQGD